MFCKLGALADEAVGEDGSIGDFGAGADDEVMGEDAWSDINGSCGQLLTEPFSSRLAASMVAAGPILTFLMVLLFKIFDPAPTSPIEETTEFAYWLIIARNFSMTFGLCR